MSTGELRLFSLTHRPAESGLQLPCRPFDRQRLRATSVSPLTLANGDLKAHRATAGAAAADVASDAALDAWLRQATTYSHISGTCRMGPGTDPMAVVDQYGKVHGLEGVRIVDASIMPNLVRAPINPTVVMMGERLAALMSQGK